MRSNYLPLPMNQRDRIHAAVAEGFIFSEAKHAPLTSLLSHAHEHASLNLLLNGVFDESYATWVANCSQFSLLFRPVGEKHTNRFGRSGAHILSIEIENPRLNAIGNCDGALEHVWQWKDGRVISIAKKIWRELRMKDAAAGLALESLALELLALGSRHFHSRKRDRNAPMWLRLVRSILHDRFRENLSVNELAALAQVHPVYFARAFSRFYGCTPGAYLRQLRLQWALGELANSERSVSEIAQEAGFYDQSHFTRSLKQAVGWTPARFRRQACTLNEVDSCKSPH